MSDIGVGEIAVILVVALLVFGPDRLPTMIKQAASFVSDLRTMVANARRDLSDSVGDLGIDQEDLKTLSDLRNPKSFVRQRVLDGADLSTFGLDEVEEIGEEFNLDGQRKKNRGTTRPSSARRTSRTNNGSTSARTRDARGENGAGSASNTEAASAEDGGSTTSTTASRRSRSTGTSPVRAGAARDRVEAGSNGAGTNGAGGKSVRTGANGAGSAAKSAGADTDGGGTAAPVEPVRAESGAKFDPDAT